MKREEAFGDQIKYMIARNINGKEEIMATSTNFSENPEFIMVFDSLGNARGFITRFLKELLNKLTSLQKLNEYQRTKVMIDLLAFRHIYLKQLYYTYDSSRTVSHEYKIPKNYQTILREKGMLETFNGESDGVG